MMINPNRRGLIAGSMAFGALAGQAIARPLAQNHTGFTKTKGGSGGRTVHVTSLAATGPGSLRAALESSGPRTIVFDVGGVIDLDSHGLNVKEPFVTIAGETAPGPGITLIRGGMSVGGHDVIIRHIAVRPGTAGKPKHSGFEPDGLSTVAARDVIIDHCSFTWAVDEALSASGPRFDGGETAEAWRAHTSSRVTFSNNLIARSLRDATHSKGPHSMGSLIHDNVTDVLLIGNLYADNNERHPLMKGGARAVVVNNVFVNPGHTCAQYTLVADQWQGHTPQTGALVLCANVLRGGADSPAGLAMLTFGGAGDLDLHAADNIATHKDGTSASVIGYYQARPDGLTDNGPYAPVAWIRSMAREAYWPSGLKILAARNVEASVYKAAGARPWARDPIDQTIVDEARAGTGRLIDSQDEMGGYPVRPSARKA